MRAWTLAVAAAALLAAGLWHWPATAQKAPPAAETAKAAASAPITFAAYRDFRLETIARRQAQLARELAAPGLSPERKAALEGRKAYYDRLAAMPADTRDKLFRARFDQIDTNRDGTLDDAERAAWRQRQRAYYAELAAERAAAENGRH